MVRNTNAMNEAEVKKTIKNLVYDLPQYRQAVDEGNVGKEEMMGDIEIATNDIIEAEKNLVTEDFCITEMDFSFDYFVQSYLSELGVVDYTETDKRVEPYETVALLYLFTKEVIPITDIVELPEDDTPVDYRILSESSSDEEDTGGTMTRAEVEKQEYHERMRDQVTVDATSPDSHEREQEPRW